MFPAIFGFKGKPKSQAPVRSVGARNFNPGARMPAIMHI